MADQSLRQIEPADLNPLIEGMPGDTLYNVQCALQFLARIHEEWSDGHFQAERHDASTPMDMNSAEHRGFALLLHVAGAAVRYVADGRLPNGGQS